MNPSTGSLRLRSGQAGQVVNNIAAARLCRVFVFFWIPARRKFKVKARKATLRSRLRPSLFYFASFFAILLRILLRRNRLWRDKPVGMTVLLQTLRSSFELIIMSRGQGVQLYY